MAAARELLEETGLAVPVAELRDLGTHAYLPRKDLALFAWLPAVMPDPATLICSSMVQRPGLHDMPELDRFGVFAFAAAQALVGRNLARVLRDVWPGLASGQAGSAG